MYVPIINAVKLCSVSRPCISIILLWVHVDVCACGSVCMQVCMCVFMFAFYGSVEHAEMEREIPIPVSTDLHSLFRQDCRKRTLNGGKCTQ